MKKTKRIKHIKKTKHSKKIKIKNYSKNKTTKKRQNKTRRRTITRTKKNQLTKQKGGTIDEINSGLLICEKLKRGIDQIKQDILMHEFNIKSALETGSSDEHLKTLNEFLKNSSETLGELEHKFSIKKDEMLELLQQDVQLINEMNPIEQDRLLTKIKQILNFGLFMEPEMKTESTETELLNMFIKYNEFFTENEVLFSTKKKNLDEQLKEIQFGIERNNMTSVIGIPKLKETLNIVLQDIDKTLSAITLFENKINDPNTGDETKIKLENKLKELKKNLNDHESKKTSIQLQLLRFKNQKKDFENMLETLNNNQINLIKTYELKKTNTKNSFLLYLNTNISFIGKILFEPNANLEAQLKIKGTLSLFGISPESIKPEYEKNKTQQMTTSIQTAEQMAEQLIREEDEARLLKAKQKVEQTKIQQKPTKEKVEKKLQQKEVKKEKTISEPVKQKAVLKKQESTSVQQYAVKEKSSSEAYIKKQERKKQKATISRIILDYWRPIIKKFLNVSSSDDINIMDELLKMKDYVKQMIRDEILPESGIASNSCTQLLQIIKNYSGIEKGFQRTNKNITRETCMIGIVMAFISNILDNAKLCILLLKGSASVQIYTEQIKQIQDLDFIILPHPHNSETENPYAEQQKELAFQISILVIWLLSDVDINLLLINAFKNTSDISDRIPKQLISLDDAKQFKIIVDDENKVLFDSLQIDKGDNVKIVLTINPSVEGGTYSYYPIIDIGYGFNMFEPGLQKIYLENISKTNSTFNASASASASASSSESNLSFYYLKMDGLFDEICYHLLSYYFSGKEVENSFYISKVAGYLSVILPLTEGYICDPTKPVEVETCVINIILENLYEIYYEYLLKLYPTTNIEELKPIFKNIVNGIYNNKKTQFINRIVDDFFKKLISLTTKNKK